MGKEMTQKKESFVNGIDVDRIFGTIDRVKEQPEMARFTFRATNQWRAGTHNQATVKDFYGALQEDSSRDPMVFDLDEPPVLYGTNLGANPVEYLLVALSGCRTTTMIAHAAARGIEIRKVESRYEGDIDLRGFLGISDDVPVGYKEIGVYFKIDADISEERKEELVAMAQKYSPVFNTIARPIVVSVGLDKT
jgi:uncharacterized OsmC-like protein